MPLLRDLPINQKITVVLLGVCGAALVVFTVTLFALQTGAMRAIVTRQVATVGNLAADHAAAAVVTQDTAEIAKLLASLRADKIIISASVLDAAGRVLGTYGPAETNDPPAAGSTQDPESLRLSTPIFWEGRRIGSFELRAQTHILEHTMASSLTTSLAVSLTLSLGVTLLVLRPTGGILTRPIHLLATTANQITREHNYQLRAPKLGEDELGQLADAFNTMLARVQVRQNELQAAEQRYRQLFERSPLPLWVVATDDQQILAVNDEAVVHYGYSREEFLSLKFPELEASPAPLDVPAGRPAAGTVERCHRRKDGAVRSVELTSREQDFAGRPARLVQAVDVTEQRQAEQALRASEEYFRNVVENLSDGLLLQDATGRVLLGNNRLAELLGWPPVEFAERTAEKFLPAAPHPRRGGERQQYEAELTRADGSRIPVAITTTSLNNKCTGEALGTVAVVTDLTAHKRAESEIAESQSRLIEVSRLAGMAEVATGVLHNVGNVLNSVNVSANLIADRLRQSRLAGLQRTVKLLDQHQGDLGRFFTEEPKGRLIPEYLSKLAWQLESERTELVEELAGLTKNLDHIKEVVAMQQNFARADGVREVISVAVLLEDALRLQEETLVRNRVTVERAYEADVPRVAVEKNKVLEILINLLTNARQAVLEVERPDRRIHLRVAQTPDRKVRVEITDNGVGIAEENRVRIFQHGFTTKKTGHGFGLHSGALAARQMGGSLAVTSPGPGLGATFRLELPVDETVPAAA